MSEQLSINIDVARAKAGLDQLRQSFGALKSSAEQNVSAASSAVQKLNVAMSSLRGINPAAAESITRLQTAMSGLSNNANLTSLAASLRQIASADIGRVSQQLQSLSAALSTIRVPPALAQLVQQLQAVGSAAQHASQQVSGAAGGFNSFGGNAGRAREGVNQFGGALSTTRNLLGGFGIALGAVGFSQFITGSFDAMKSANGFKAALTGITGDSGLAADAMKYVSDMADKLAIDITAARNGFKDYAAAALSSGQPMDAVKRTFEGVSTAARVLNLSADDTMGVFRALGQMAGKGIVNMEDLRQQIGDRMPGAIDAMAQALGVGKDQLYDMVKAGEVSADVLPQFADRLKEIYARGLPDALNTAEAAWTRFHNTLNDAMASFGAGFFAPLTESFNALSKSFDGDGFQKLGDTLGQLSAGIIEGFVSVVDVLRGFMDVIGNVATGVGDLLSALGLVPDATNAVGAAATNTVTPMEALGIALGVAAAAGLGMMAISALSGVLTGIAAAARVASAALLTLSRHPLVMIGTLAATGVALVAFGDKLGEMTKSTDKTDTSLSNAKTAVETFGGSTEELKEKMQAVKEQAGEFATAQDKLAKGFEKTSEAAVKLPGPMGQLQTVVGTLNEPLANVAKSLGTVGLMFETMQTSIPVAKDQLNEFAGIIPTVDEVIKPLPVTLAGIADALEKMVRDMPMTTSLLGELGATASTATDPLGSLAGSMSSIAGAHEGTKKTQEAFAGFVGSINDAAKPIEDAAGNLAKLSGAAYGVAGGFEKAIEEGTKFTGSLDAVNVGVERTIELMNDLKEAAESAFKAAQAASGAGGGGDVSASAQREGGYAGDRLASQMVALSAFNSAPQFAEGTANTSRYSSRVPGGGIPSILHPNEAVVPLSRGRSIPVDLSMAMPSSTMQAPEMDLSPLQMLAASIDDLASSMSMPVPDIHISAPSSQQNTAPLIPPQARESIGDIGLGSSGRGSSGGRDGERTRGTGDNSGSVVVNVGDIIVKADDPASFNRSKDQMRRQFQAEINRAVRRSRG